MTDGTDVAIGDLGPVDYLILEFSAGAHNFTGEVVAEIARLSEAGTIRIIDLLVLSKGVDGTVDALEIADLGEQAEIRVFESQVSGVVAVDDLDALGQAIHPGSMAGVIVWENCWARPFTVAALQAGGHVVATGRLPLTSLSRTRAGFGGGSGGVAARTRESTR